MGAMSFYRCCLRPLLFSADPETVHHASMALLARFGPLLNWWTQEHEASLARTVFGVRFPSPLGLAAGFDKNAVALPGWEWMGFGFVEIGTVTAQGQPGNPLPRLFRIPSQGAVINRFGFNNDGAARIAERLRALRASGDWPSTPVGVNLGKSKVTPLEEANADYVESFRALREFGDYFVLNVSSPNTPGLRQLQDKSALESLLNGPGLGDAGVFFCNALKAGWCYFFGFFEGALYFSVFGVGWFG